MVFLEKNLNTSGAQQFIELQNCAPHDVLGLKTRNSCRRERLSSRNNMMQDQAQSFWWGANPTIKAGAMAKISPNTRGA